MFCVNNSCKCIKTVISSNLFFTKTKEVSFDIFQKFLLTPNETIYIKYNFQSKAKYYRI